MDQIGEIYTSTGRALGDSRERWLVRATEGQGRRLSAIRDHLIEQAKVQRHSVVLDLRAGSGLLTWEALRQAPEGGVYCLSRSVDAGAQLIERAKGLDMIDLPNVLTGEIDEIGDLLALRREKELRFDIIIGWRALEGVKPRTLRKLVDGLHALLAPGSRLCLAEDLPGAGSRPLDLIDPSGSPLMQVEDTLDDAKDDSLLQRARIAESKIYASDERLSRSSADFSKVFGKRGAWNAKDIEIEYETQELPISDALIARWFDTKNGYAARLGESISEEDIRRLRSRFGAIAGGRAPAWKTAALILQATKAGSVPESEAL